MPANKSFKHKCLKGLATPLAVFWLCVFSAKAALLIEVGHVKVTGDKTLVPLTLKNTFHDRISSAKATIILLSEKGTSVGKLTRWVIGGNTNRPPLLAGKSVSYYVVIPATNSFKEAKVIVDKLVLGSAGTQPVSGNVTVTNATNAK